MTQPPPWDQRPAAQPNPYARPGEAYPPNGPYAPPDTPRPPTRAKGLSITAFVLGLLGCLPLASLAAIAVGVAALVKKQALRGLAVAGIVLGLLWTIGGVVFFASGAASRLAESVQEAVEDASSPDASGAGSGGEAIESPDLRLGDCFNDPDALGVGPDEEYVSGVLERLPCDEPHALEVYHVADVPGGAYPGEDALLDEVQQACLTAFTDFVGVPYEDSVIEVIYYYPTVQTWEEIDDRSIVCAVTDGESTTGSLQGAGR